MSNHNPNVIYTTSISIEKQFPPKAKLAIQREGLRNSLLSFFHYRSAGTLSNSWRFNPRIQDTTEVYQQQAVSQFTAVTKPGFL